MSRAGFWAVLIGGSVLIGLLVFALVVTVFAQGWSPGDMMGNWFGSGWSGSNTPWSGGMMGGYGMMDGWGFGPSRGFAPWSGGMMGMMGGAYGPQGMMSGWSVPSQATPLTLDEAVNQAQDYLAALGNLDLTLTEVMEFDNHFYAEVVEESMGIGAFEVLIDRYTGAVYPEIGPNMMWNTKYGHMGRGGMMGLWSTAPTGEMSVTLQEARDLAQAYLDQNLPGTTVAEEADTFYGYYTSHVLKDGQIIGMLSVNGYNGQVWYHSWHGTFLGMQELE